VFVEMPHSYAVKPKQFYRCFMTAMLMYNTAAFLAPSRKTSQRRRWEDAWGNLEVPSDDKWLMDGYIAAAAAHAAAFWRRRTTRRNTCDGDRRGTLGTRVVLADAERVIDGDCSPEKAWRPRQPDISRGWKSLATKSF
jgi:hypothetical protein